MDPGDLPDELNGLCLVEKLAISLVSPIYILYIIKTLNTYLNQKFVLCVWNFLAYIFFIFVTNQMIISICTSEILKTHV
jgi:hypothetical protein